MKTRYLELLIMVALILSTFLISVKLSYGQTLQGLLNDIDNQKSYREQLIDHVLNKVNWTVPGYQTAEEGKNQSARWVTDLSVEELEQIVRDGSPYAVIADHINAVTAPSLKRLCAVIDPDNC